MRALLRVRMTFSAAWTAIFRTHVPNAASSRKRPRFSKALRKLVWTTSSASWRCRSMFIASEYTPRS